METLKCSPVRSSAISPPIGRKPEIEQHQESPLERAEHGIQHQHDDENGQRNHDRQAVISALLALVFAGPFQRVALRQFHFAIDLHHGLLDGAAKVAASHAVLDGDVALVPFPVDHRCAVFDLDVSDFGQRDALAAGRYDANVANVVHRPAELFLVARDQIEALLTNKDLANRIAADCRLDGVLNVGGIDAKAVSLLSIDRDIDIGLTEHAKKTEISDAWYGRITAMISSPFCSRSFRSEPKILTASSPFTPLTASSMLSAMGWENPQVTPGIFSTSLSMASMSSSFRPRNCGRHSSRGLRSTKYSVLKNPVASVPSSERPTCDTTLVTSGKPAKMRRA